MGGPRGRQHTDHGTEAIEDLLDLEPDHIDQLCALLKTTPMLSMERPSTSHGAEHGAPGNRSGVSSGPFAGDYAEQRPSTAEGHTRDSFGTEMADGSFGRADQTSGYEASEYRRRLDEFRQMSAPDLAGSAAFGESLGAEPGGLPRVPYCSRPSKPLQPRAAVCTRIT